MRFSFTLILLLLSSIFLVKAQNNTSESQSEDEDRKRLENQFKALKNFYINDQGLVVYQTQSNDAQIVEDYSKYAAENTSDTLVVYVDEFSTADSPTQSLQVVEDNPYTGQEATESHEYTSSSAPAGSSIANVVSISKKPINPASYSSSAPAQAQTETVNITPTPEVSSGQATPPETESRATALKPATRPTISNTSSRTPAATTPTATSRAARNLATEKANVSSPVSPDVKSVSPDTKNTKEVNVAEEKKTKPATPSSSRKSVFQKDPSIYNSLEEAATVTQELLEKLKSEQAGSKSSGSLSSRLSKGAGKSSFKKDQSSVGDSFASGRMGNRPIISEKTVEAEKKYEEASTPYTVEPTPTYYINGVEVDKTVVDKLRKADILSREVRSRNTQSGNPAGEVWIQLK